MLRGLTRETDLTVVGNLLGQAAVTAGSYTPPATRAATATTWQQGLRRLLHEAAAGSDHQLALARAFVGAARDEDCAAEVEGWLDGRDVPAGLELDQDLRWAVVARLAGLGRADEALIAAEERARRLGHRPGAGRRRPRRPPDRRGQGRGVAARRGRGHHPQRPAERHLPRLLAAPAGRACCSPTWSATCGWRRTSRPSRGVWATKGVALRKSALRNLFPWPADLQPFLEQLDAWLADAEIAPSVRRIILERRDEAVRALACQRVGSA